MSNKQQFFVITIIHFRLYFMKHLFHVMLTWAKSVHLMYAPFFVSLYICYLTMTSVPTIVFIVATVTEEGV